MGAVDHRKFSKKISTGNKFNAISFLDKSEFSFEPVCVEQQYGVG